MNISPRRVATTLAIISVVSFGGSIIASGVSICSDAKDCAAAVILGTTSAQKTQSITMPQSTESVTTPAASYPSTSIIGIQLTALYVLMIAIAIFIVMEFYRPTVTKRFLGKRRHAH